METLRITFIPFLFLLIAVFGPAGSIPAAADDNFRNSSKKPPRPFVEFTPVDRAETPDAPAIAFGAPGTTYGFFQRFGTSQQAYLDDANHLVNPYAVSSRGGNVWIADSKGNRVLQYDNAGVFIRQLGKSGFREYYQGYGTSFEWLTDVVEDGSANTWVSDGGAHHVSIFNPAGVILFQLGTPWVPGDDNDHFNSPRGIAFDASGNAYIADTNNHRIQIYDSGGNYINTLGSQGIGDFQFDHPNHPAIDADNHLFVADEGNHRVQIFDVNDPSTILLIGVIGTTGDCSYVDDRLCSPTAVDVDAAKIYIADSGNARVMIFDRATLAYSAKISGGSGSGYGEFFEPSDVAVDSAGNIYISDPANMRVQMYSSDGIFIHSFGTTGVPYLSVDGLFNSPTGIAVTADNSIYLTEGRGNRLIKLAPNGAIVWQVGEPGIGGQDYQHLLSPEGVAVDTQNRVFVADAGNHRVQVFAGSGQYLDTIGTTQGAGENQFNYPSGVAIAPNGNILVADSKNHRVQVFNSSLGYIFSLGQTGSPGSGNDLFDHPIDVAVDPAGNIYVLDHSNHRVQVFSSGFAFLRTIGIGGGTNFGYLKNPTALAVDPSTGYIFIASSLGAFIDVYSSSGAFLTRINSNYTGSSVGQFLQVQGLAVDGDGAVFAADSLNHVVEKWTAGVPYFSQINVSGFGDSRAWGAWSLASLNDRLYVGTYASTTKGGAIHRFTNGTWETVATGGFGDPTNFAVESFAKFGSNLYAGLGNYLTGGTSKGGAIWRSPTGNSGTWIEVVSGGFDSTFNGEIVRMAVFENYLYAATWSWDTTVHGGQIWRSATGDAGDWTKVFDDTSTGDNNNEAIVTLAEFEGHLYAGTWNSVTGGELWHSDDGLVWTQVGGDGFGNPNNSALLSLTDFNGGLYAGFRNTTSGGQIWRSYNGANWEQVVADGFGDAGNTRPQLIVFKSNLFVVMGNLVNGSQIWRSPSGNPAPWTRIVSGGFGQGIAVQNSYDWSLAVLNDNLYIGTSSPGNGGARIWLYLDNSHYLPLIQR